MPNLCVPGLLENLHLVTAGQRPHTAPLDAAPSHGLSGLPSVLLPAKQSGKAHGRKVRAQVCAVKELLPFHLRVLQCRNCFVSSLLNMNLIRDIAQSFTTGKKSSASKLRLLLWFYVWVPDLLSV